MQEYDPAQQRLVGERHNVFMGTRAGLTEAPHIRKRDGWYYLLTAGGGTYYQHQATLARSRSLFGPYKVPGHLRLFGCDTIGSVFRQALVARRQQAFCYGAHCDGVRAAQHCGSPAVISPYSPPPALFTMHPRRWPLGSDWGKVGLTHADDHR